MNIWKENWAESREHFLNWWDRKGTVFGRWGYIENQKNHDPNLLIPPKVMNHKEVFLNPEARAEIEHWKLAHGDFPDDMLPIADFDFGPGSVALCLGSEPDYTSTSSVWYSSPYEHFEDISEIPQIKLDKSNKYFQIQLDTLKAGVKNANGNYWVGFPDLIENLDLLASLRGSQELMMDMIINPEEVEKRAIEITDAWFEVYDAMYDVIQAGNDGVTYSPFKVWSSGKGAKVQCDMSAMLSPEMFDRFAVPSLIRQCEWLDHSLYHLDGTQAIVHLDSLLKIDALDAIEWTPQAGIETGGDKRWYPLYKKILEAGKSVQIICRDKSQLKDLFNAIGTDGIYIIG